MKHGESTPGAVASGSDRFAPGQLVAARAAEVFGTDALGVVLLGSWVRGDMTASSDVDALVVVASPAAVTRAAHRVWDQVPLSHGGRTIDVHVIALPTEVTDPGGVWLEAAMDGVVVSDRDGRIAQTSTRVRHAIDRGDWTRHRAHGQPYWTRKERCGTRRSQATKASAPQHPLT